jgi:hypothetical protein
MYRAKCVFILRNDVPVSYVIWLPAATSELINPVGVLQLPARLIKMTLVPEKATGMNRGPFYQKKAHRVAGSPDLGRGRYRIEKAAVNLIFRCADFFRRFSIEW